jgi:hypothetical protein
MCLDDRGSAGLAPLRWLASLPAGFIVAFRSAKECSFCGATGDYDMLIAKRMA